MQRGTSNVAISGGVEMNITRVGSQSYGTSVRRQLAYSPRYENNSHSTHGWREQISLQHSSLSLSKRRVCFLPQYIFSNLMPLLTCTSAY